MNAFPLFATAAVVSLLSSCGTVQSLSSATTGGIKKVGTGVSDGFGTVKDIAMSPFEPDIPVVEARPEDFRKQQTGQEQAIAFQREQERRRSFWNFGGAFDFEEPDLPDEPQGVMDGGLLPPLEP
ncbi:MAG: hypothetical protein MUF31_05895 [Akkermansiaceae bacterium]|jgi:hypothetical protein|nr:hypothetical protein [Akkermansiaceae bacterium]